MNAAYPTVTVYMGFKNMILNERNQEQDFYTAWLHLYKVLKWARLIYAVTSQDSGGSYME